MANAVQVQPEPNNFKEMLDKIKAVGQTIIDKYKAKEECKYYDQTKAADTAHSITEETIKELTSLYTTYKFTATCTLLNKKEGGLHMSSSCYWNNSTDGNILLQDDNEALHFVLNIFALY